MTNFRIAPSGDSAIVVELEARIDPEINEQAIRLAETVQAAAIAGVRDVVPTYRSVAVFFDPLRTDYRQLVEPAIDVQADLVLRLQLDRIGHLGGDHSPGR